MRKTFEYESNIISAGDFCALLTVTIEPVREMGRIAGYKTISIINETGENVTHSDALDNEVYKQVEKQAYNFL